MGVVDSDTAEGEGEGGASDAEDDAARPGLLLDGFESFEAAEARDPLKALDCFSRKEDMVLLFEKSERVNSERFREEGACVAALT